MLWEEGVVLFKTVAPVVLIKLQTKHIVKKIWQAQIDLQEFKVINRYKIGQVGKGLIRGD